MELQLINEELCESRLYRTSQNFRTLTGRDIANLAYLNSLIYYIMVQDNKQHDYARALAKRTAQYGSYTLFRTHATDLYMLCYIIKDPENKHLRYRDHGESKRFLKTLNFNSNYHIQFMRKIANADDRKNEALTYYMRLESQLKITDSRYKQFRRYATDWGNLKFASKQQVVSRITQEIRRIAKGSEVMAPLTTMIKYRSHRTISDYKEPRTSFTKRVAGTAAGAVAGRYIGKKIAQKTGKNVDKYKKAGTGLGAIAGYWASGRKKQV